MGLNAIRAIVSFAVVFWMSRNAPPSLGGALRDIQETAAKETRTKTAVKCSKIKKRSSKVCNSAIFYNEICKLELLLSSLVSLPTRSYTLIQHLFVWFL